MSVHGSRVRTAERTSSAAGIGRARSSQTQAPAAPVGQRTTTSGTGGGSLNGDQLLCKCLEKGHEILRKVEELTTVVSPALRIRTVSRISSSTHYPATPPGQRKAVIPPSSTKAPSVVIHSSVMTQTAQNGGTTTTTTNTTVTSSTSATATASATGGSGTIHHQKQQQKLPKTTASAGAGEKKATGGGGTVTKVMGRAATTLASGGGSSNRLLATVDSSRRLAAGKAPPPSSLTATESSSSSSTGGGATSRLNSSCPGSIARGTVSPRAASSGLAAGKSWPKPSALTVAPPPLKSPALVKQNKSLQSSKSVTAVTAAPLLFRPPSRSASLTSFLSSTSGTAAATITTTSSSSSSGIGGAGGGDSGDEKQRATEDDHQILSSTAAIPLITTDDHDARPETPPKIVNMAGVNPSTVLPSLTSIVNPVGKVVANDSTYHESDWSEDSGRMSNENLDLLEGCSGGGGDTGSSSGEQEKPSRGGVGAPPRTKVGTSPPVVVGKLDESLLGIFEPTSPVNSPPTGDAGFAGGRWNRSPAARPGKKVNSTKSPSPPAPPSPPSSSSPALSTTSSSSVMVVAAVSLVAPVHNQHRQPIITISDDSEQVFFRSGVLGALEAKRDELLSDRVIQLQAHCRGYLARRRLARRRLQELAVRCIQRNVRAFLKVRDWPWWRLLVRVMPLLAVHRTEEQLVAATAELQQVRAKLEKIEAERNELKAANHKLNLMAYYVLCCDK